MIRGLYAIVNLPHPSGLELSAIVRALSVGEGSTSSPCAIQLRAKGMALGDVRAALTAMGPACAKLEIPLLVNDHVELALEGLAGVCGVHLGQDDRPEAGVERVRHEAKARGLPRMLVGVSTHNAVQLRAACHMDVDYVAYGPVLPTATKENPDPVVAWDGLLEACRHTFKPLVAIGGLDAQTGATAIGLGASAVALISALHGRDATQLAQRSKRCSESFAEAAREIPVEEVARKIPVLDLAQLQELARWSDDVGTHVTLGLPARFRPPVRAEGVFFRPCDVLDLLYVLDKRPDESWEAWQARGRDGPLANLVQLGPRD